VTGEKPNWRHADGRPYDELDYGHTRWADELDAGSKRPSRVGRLLRSLLPGAASRTLGQSRDERRFDDD
jgi:hypothetical protein